MMRLSKYLQQCGVGSRSKAEELILSNRVKVNDLVVTEAFTRVSDTDQVTVDDQPIQLVTEKVYFALNKPVGYSCAEEDGCEKVSDLFSHLPYRVFTVGRLDNMSEGLILVTNDGDFSKKLTEPSSNVEKEYLVQVDRPLTKDDLKIIADGNPIDGQFIKPHQVSKTGKDSLKITIGEGKKREIRYLLYNAHLEALSIKRIRIGKLVLDDLASGQFKPFDPQDFFS